VDPGLHAGPSRLAAPPTVDDLRGRIRRYNNGLDPSGQTFRAALVLLAGSAMGQNVEGLARRTGLDRAFVSRCARRLIDNGVWVGGRVVADWSAENTASGTFWNDVAVAEGKMCRRVRADGSLEWAPAGFWNKNFHFIDPDADSRLGNQYLDPSGPETHPAAGTETPDGSAEAGNPVPADGSGERAPGAPPPEAADSVSADELVDTEEPSTPTLRNTAAEEEEHSTPEKPESQLAHAAPSLHHVFRDAVWLG
jgi:hypothetical protein